MSCTPRILYVRCDNSRLCVSPSKETEHDLGRAAQRPPNPAVSKPLYNSTIPVLQNCNCRILLPSLSTEPWVINTAYTLRLRNSPGQKNLLYMRQSGSCKIQTDTKKFKIRQRPVATEQTGLCLPTLEARYDGNLRHENCHLQSQFGNKTVSSH